MMLEMAPDARASNLSLEPLACDAGACDAGMNLSVYIIYLPDDDPLPVFSQFLFF